MYRPILILFHTNVKYGAILILFHTNVKYDSILAKFEFEHYRARVLVPSLMDQLTSHKC